MTRTYVLEKKICISTVHSISNSDKYVTDQQKSSSQRSGPPLTHQASKKIFQDKSGIKLCFLYSDKSVLCLKYCLLSWCNRTKEEHLSFSYLIISESVAVTEVKLRSCEGEGVDKRIFNIPIFLSVCLMVSQRLHDLSQAEALGTSFCAPLWLQS